MSNTVDRFKVFQTTRVRTARKNDGCWIQKSKEEKEEQDKARTDCAVETRPSPVRMNSYVLSTAKKFESVDSPLSPPSQKMQFAPSEGPTKELIQSGETQPQKSVANTTAENKEEYPAVHHSNVEHNDDGAAEVSAEINVAERNQNGEAHAVSSTKKNPEAESPVEPAEQPVANTTAENKGERVDTTVDQSNVEQNGTKVTADAHVEDPVAVPPAVAGTEKCKDTAELPVVPPVDLKPQEEPSAETEPADGTHSEVAGVESVQPAEGSHEKCPPELAAEEIVEAVAEVVSKSSPDTCNVVRATPGKEAALQESVEAVAEVAVAPENPAVTHAAGEEAAPQNSVEAVAEVVVAPENPAAGEEAAPQNSVEAVAEVVVKSLPETPAVTDAAGDEAALKVSVEPVPDLVAESVSDLPTQTATENATEGSGEKGPPEQAAGKTVEAAAKVAVESSPPDISNVINATSGKEVALQDSVEAVAEAAVKSSPETPPVTGAAGEEAALQVSVESVPDLVADAVPKSPTQPPAETAVKSVESKVESAASTEPVLKTRSEEIVECQVQPVDSTAVKQSVEPTPESAADHVVKMNIEDAVEPAKASDTEAVQDKLSDRPIELSEALDVKPPTTEAASEPVKDPKQCQAQETKLTPQSDDTNISGIFQKPKEELQITQTQNGTRNTNVCSFCDKIIAGNVKIYLSEPVVTLHPDCLKCGVCAKALGDLLAPMFLHHQVVQCGDCFAIALKT